MSVASLVEVKSSLYLLTIKIRFQIQFSVTREHLNIHFDAKSKKKHTDHWTVIQALYNDVLYIHTGFAVIMSSIYF